MLENVGRNQGSEELSLVLRHKHVDLQHASAYVSIRQHTSASEELSLVLPTQAYLSVPIEGHTKHMLLRAYEIHALQEAVGDLERSELLHLLFLKQVALDAVLNSAHEANDHHETSGESGVAKGSKM